MDKKSKEIYEKYRKSFIEELIMVVKKYDSLCSGEVARVVNDSEKAITMSFSIRMELIKTYFTRQFRNDYMDIVTTPKREYYKAIIERAERDKQFPITWRNFILESS